MRKCKMNYYNLYRPQIIYIRRAQAKEKMVDQVKIGLSELINEMNELKMTKQVKL